jgi:hypothetical protein
VSEANCVRSTGNRALCSTVGKQLERARTGGSRLAGCGCWATMTGSVASDHRGTPPARPSGRAVHTKRRRSTRPGSGIGRRVTRASRPSVGVVVPVDRSAVSTRVPGRRGRSPAQSADARARSRGCFLFHGCYRDGRRPRTERPDRERTPTRATAEAGARNAPRARNPAIGLL